MKTTLYILRLVGTLFLITALVAAALAGVNAITEDRIAAAEAEKLQSAISEVLNGAGVYTALDTFPDDTGLVKAVYTSSAGYAVESAPAGFGGTVTVMVGVSPEGEVLGIRIVSHSETAGLGAVSAADTAAGRAFRDSFKGLTGKVTVSKDGGQADTITGATITSRAVAEGVSAAIACVEKINKGA